MIWLSVAILILLVVVGVPLFLSIFVGVTLLTFFVMHIDPVMITSEMFNNVNNASLIAVPLFLLSGQLLAVGGASEPLIKLLNSFMGHVPGGPAYVVVAANVVFAAMSAAGLGALAGFAPIMIPIMLKLGYTKSFSIGLLLTSATMANLIPPSIVLIIYGYITQTSILTLWTAAIIPGLLIAVLLVITIYIHTRRGHYTQLAPATWTDRWQALKRGWPVLGMPVAVLGPLYGGIATPTEVASIAVFYSLILGLFVYRGLKLRQFWDACYKTVHIMAVLFVIIMAAFLLNVAFTYVRIPFKLGEGLANLGVNWVGFMAIMIVAYLLMGAFLDVSAILLVSVPILLPTVLDLGISPIVYGIFTVHIVEIAVITPPYGINLFAAVSILGEPFGFIAKSAFMFYPAVILGTVLIAYIPQLSLWLPNLVGR
ncbi:TRAP transporter large permease [Chloroflexota bacterium]